MGLGPAESAILLRLMRFPPDRGCAQRNDRSAAYTGGAPKAQPDLCRQGLSEVALTPEDCPAAGLTAAGYSGPAAGLTAAGYSGPSSL
jgi:hypothetical protein